MHRTDATEIVLEGRNARTEQEVRLVAKQHALGEAPGGAQTAEHLEQQLRAFLLNRDMTHIDDIGKFFGPSFRRLGLKEQYGSLRKWLVSLPGIRFKDGEAGEDSLFLMADQSEVCTDSVPDFDGRPTLHGAEKEKQQQIKSFLQSCGGHARVDQVGMKFKVSRAQLTAMGFLFGEPGEHGDFYVGWQAVPPPFTSRQRENRSRNTRRSRSLVTLLPASHTDLCRRHSRSKSTSKQSHGRTRIRAGRVTLEGRFKGGPSRSATRRERLRRRERRSRSARRQRSRTSRASGRRSTRVRSISNSNRSRLQHRRSGSHSMSKHMDGTADVRTGRFRGRLESGRSRNTMSSGRVSREGVAKSQRDRTRDRSVSSYYSDESSSSSSGECSPLFDSPLRSAAGAVTLNAIDQLISESRRIATDQAVLPPVGTDCKPDPGSRQDDAALQGEEGLEHVAVQSSDVTSVNPGHGCIPEAAHEEPTIFTNPDACQATEVQTTPAHECSKTALEAWLFDLDSRRGSMLQYLEPLQREFGDLQELALAVSPVPPGVSIIKAVEPSLFEVLGVQSMGHKLKFAQGMLALAADNPPSPTPLPTASSEPEDVIDAAITDPYLDP
mmetsp:Transcript_126666/g.219573  ORF Transcript_126666/g.219573 Transcript_126666/m.219573 type:complete len:609 (-) Transcript_126666:85-1911(-)